MATKSPESIYGEHLGALQALCASHFPIPPPSLERIQTAILTSTEGTALQSAEERTAIATLATEDSGLIVLGIFGAICHHFGEDRFLGPFIQYLWELPGQHNVSEQNYDWEELRPLFKNILSRSEYVVCSNAIKQATAGHVGEDATLVHGQPALIVDALQCMIRQQQGERQRVSMYMGADAAFITAMSVWLFDLDVVLLAGQGTMVYSSKGSSVDEAQVTVWLSNPGQPSTACELATLGSSNISLEIRCNGVNSEKGSHTLTKASDSPFSGQSEFCCAQSVSKSIFQKLLNFPGNRPYLAIKAATHSTRSGATLGPTGSFAGFGTIHKFFRDLHCVQRACLDGYKLVQSSGEEEECYFGEHLMTGRYRKLRCPLLVDWAQLASILKGDFSMRTNVSLITVRSV
ncbi:hypothetical protein G647_08091 [Cladophialophora carrionii CBS 160.54]|uniref:Uncharacterized protein n=1 Tax=Cladophialophora carrionii CBS 160.54 TaxID=1279043 RepID=V9D4B1_9EURO|nr:uncharacterized protein G647_08091 [Cladophialophora carrionii CBS 160.54]ETI21744.1 hypothetical protein G647_08091 [Cladophialophora carrionii CBS 160.54]